MLNKLNEEIYFIRKSKIYSYFFLALYIIIINFILVLSRLKNNFNIIILITNKFFKRIITILDKNI